MLRGRRRNALYGILKGFSDTSELKNVNPEAGFEPVMDLSKTALFETMKGRFTWLSQRQKVLAGNIANADTPGFRPRDLEPFEFQELMRRQAGRLDMETTRPAHLGGHLAQVGTFVETVDRHPFETTPNGNAVVLEEQMAKVNETSVAHKLTTELYRKHLGMIRIALGRH